MAFGAVPRLSLVYDRSYEGFGNLLTRILQTGPSWPVSGMRTDGFKVTQTDLLFMGDNPLVLRWKVKPFHNYTFRLEFDSHAPKKFKIRFLSSC